MPLSASVSMVLRDFTVVPAPLFPVSGQDSGITVTMHFTCDQPGPGMGPDYTILLTSTDLAVIQAATTAPTPAQLLRSTVIDHLQKQYRPQVQIAAVLQGFIGQAVTIP